MEDAARAIPKTRSPMKRSSRPSISRKVLDPRDEENSVQCSMMRLKTHAKRCPLSRARIQTREGKERLLLRVVSAFLRS